MADVSTITANGITYDVKDVVARNKLSNAIYVVTVESFSSFPKTVTDANITSDMVVLECTFGTPDAITSDVTCVTSNGQLQLSGTITDSTTATIVLGKSSF